MLGNAGFKVTTAPNLAQNDMRQAISDFAGQISASGADTVALVFYAGHGLQIDGENYLVPVDLDPKREADIPLQGVRLNDLLNTLGALPTKARIFMLDACRNNPFPALSGAGHGLAIVDTRAGAPGSFISYSTSPGAEAEDGSGADSPYTTAALSIAKQPGLPIEEVFKRIRVSVAQSTDGRQIPWESSSLTSDFKFFGSESGNQPPSPAAGSGSAALASATRSVDDWRKELQGKEQKVAYELVIADDSVSAYEAYVDLFAQAPSTPRVRTILERRRQMLAWERAVAINTRTAYEVYLANWGNSDLAATARRLLLRVQNRDFGPTAAAAAPVAVALAPTCPCSAPSSPATPVNPTVAPIIKKRVDDTPPAKKKVVDTPRRKPPPDEVVVQHGPPPGPPPGAVMEGIGIGVGIGLGMGMGGRGGGEMGHGDYRR
ncbi:MAG TPA: caspase family protein [Rhodocyclaceae bacterium]